MRLFNYTLQSFEKYFYQIVLINIFLYFLGYLEYQTINFLECRF